MRVMTVSSAYSVEGICPRSVGEDIFEGVEVGGAERTIMNKCGLRGQPCRMPRWRDDNELIKKLETTKNIVFVQGHDGLD